MFAEWLKLPKHGPEISDAITSFDPETLERKHVYKADVISSFAQIGNRTAVKIVEKMPERDGILDAATVDKILIGAHCEMQRISEEFQHGRRVAELITPILRTLREHGIDRRIRIVDIGCGTGFVLRWLTAKRALENVELIGVDFNAALVEEAARLAKAEGLDCQFRVANAFSLAEPADIYLSTGILHHFHGAALNELFKNQSTPQTVAFVHFDFYNMPLAPLGSWLFHAVWMRMPLTKHDGVLSAMRTHKCGELLDTVKSAAPDFAAMIFGVRLWGLPVPRVFHSVVGIRPGYKPGFLKHLGKRRIYSLGVME